MAKSKLPSNSSSGNEEEEEEEEGGDDADNWVQCDRCNKWRRLSAAEAAKVDSNEPW